MVYLPHKCRKRLIDLFNINLHLLSVNWLLLPVYRKQFQMFSSSIKTKQKHTRLKKIQLNKIPDRKIRKTESKYKECY